MKIIIKNLLNQIQNNRSNKLLTNENKLYVVLLIITEY